jgi:hypothetical protein
MRRVWAAVLSVWSTLAIVGVLAWSHPVQPAAHVVVLPNGAAVQTLTSSSKVATRPATQLVSGVQVQTQTRSS